MYTRSDPFYSLMNRLWDPTFPTTGDHSLTPAADIIEKDGEWLFRVDMPGVEKENIDIQVDGDQLVVSGKRHEEVEDKKDGYTYIERVDGRFERRFTLPETADREKITAKTKSGVLDIHVGKQPEAKPRRIAIEEH